MKRIRQTRDKGQRKWEERSVARRYRFAGAEIRLPHRILLRPSIHIEFWLARCLTSAPASSSFLPAWFVETNVHGLDSNEEERTRRSPRPIFLQETEKKTKRRKIAATPRIRSEIRCESSCNGIVIITCVTFFRNNWLLIVVHRAGTVLRWNRQSRQTKDVPLAMTNNGKNLRVRGDHQKEMTRVMIRFDTLLLSEYRLFVPSRWHPRIESILSTSIERHAVCHSSSSFRSGERRSSSIPKALSYFLFAYLQLFITRTTSIQMHLLGPRYRSIGSAT